MRRGMGWGGFLVLWVLACQGAPGPVLPRPSPASSSSPAIVSHRLDVRLLPAAARLEAEDTVLLAGRGEVLRFQLLDGLRLLSVQLRKHSLRFRSEGVALGRRARRTWAVDLPADRADDAELRIRYAGELPRSAAVLGAFDTIAADGAYLLRAWYPDQRRHRADFQLRAEIPVGWQLATNAAVQVEASEGSTTRIVGRMSRPVASLPLAAGPFHRRERTAAGVRIATLLRRDDAELSEALLSDVARNLAEYSRLLGPYPYEKFEWVEGPGGGLGTLWQTMLSGYHLADPGFRSESNTGHEIVHAWFGHHVAVDPDGGDWGEGLTTYLGDHYRQEGQTGTLAAAYRARAVVGYYHWIGKEAPFALADYHDDPVPNHGPLGYARAALFLHDLRRRIGTAAFFQALRDVVARRGGDYAGWEDFQAACEAASGRSLAFVFEQGLKRRGLPWVALRAARALEGLPPSAELSFEQRSDEVYDLELEVELECEGAEPVRRVVHLDRDQVVVRLEELPGPLRRVRVDPDHHLLRYRPGTLASDASPEDVVDVQRP